MNRNAKRLLLLVPQLLVPRLLVACGSSAMAQASLTVGVSGADIAPPDGFAAAGYYHEHLAEGTIDPLNANTSVLVRAIVDAGEDRIANAAQCKQRRLFRSPTTEPDDSGGRRISCTTFGCSYWYSPTRQPG